LRLNLAIGRAAGHSYAKTVAEAMKLKIDADNPVDREKLRRVILDLVADEGAFPDCQIPKKPAAEKAQAVKSLGYAMHRSRSYHAVIRVYDAAGNLTETHEHTAISRVVSFVTQKVSTSLARFE
jgi:hypothetical protein